MIQPVRRRDLPRAADRVQRRATARPQFGVVYTLSRTTNYPDNDANPRIQLPSSTELNKGPAGYDRTHNLQTYWVWDLPFGQGQRWARGRRRQGDLRRLAGQRPHEHHERPRRSTSSRATAVNLNAGGSGQYPDQVKDRTSRSSAASAPATAYFDPSAFAAVNIPAGQPQRFGNSGAQPDPRARASANVDLGLFRTIGARLAARGCSSASRR